MTVQSALELEPRACGDTAVSRALVELVAVPPHSVDPPEQSTFAAACETLTGPDTAATPAWAGWSVAARSATVVSDSAAQPAPAPRAEQDDVPVLSRTPITSPDAAPEVVELPEPVQAEPSQSTLAPAWLVAVSSCPTGAAAASVPSAARRLMAGRVGTPLSVASELDSTRHPPAVASQLEEPLVSRTAAGPPAVAFGADTLPLVAIPALPEQPARPSQSTLACALLDAPPSPSVTDTGAAPEVQLASRVRCTSTELFSSVPDRASHPPPFASQLAEPLLARSVPACTPEAVPPVAVAPLPEQLARSQSTRTLASPAPTEAPPSPRPSSSARAPLCAAHPPPVTLQFAEPLLVDSAARAPAGTPG